MEATHNYLMQLNSASLSLVCHYYYFNTTSHDAQLWDSTRSPHDLAPFVYKPPQETPPKACFMSRSALVKTHWQLQQPVWFSLVSDGLPILSRLTNASRRPPSETASLCCFPIRPSANAATFSTEKVPDFERLKTASRQG